MGVRTVAKGLIRALYLALLVALMGTTVATEGFGAFLCYLLYLGVLFGPWWALSYLGREKSQPAGFDQLPTPPLHPFTFVYVAENDEVKAVFAGRRASRWFHVKACVGAWVLLLLQRLGRFVSRGVWESTDGSRPFLQWLREFCDDVHRRLAELDQRTRYCVIRPVRPGVVGYAALEGKGSTTVVLGLEPWILDRGPLTRSAADHELLHGVQETHAKALTNAWEVGEQAGERLYALGTRAWYEFHAGALGSPLILYSAMWVVFLPLVGKL